VLDDSEKHTRGVTVRGGRASPKRREETEACLGMGGKALGCKHYCISNTVRRDESEADAEGTRLIREKKKRGKKEK